MKVKSGAVNGKSEISFKDTGKGMAKETLSKLKWCVQLFTNKVKGIGSGLSICKCIAKANGGKIVVKSKVRKEIMVTVAISVEPEPISEGGENWILNESALSTMTATRGAEGQSFPQTLMFSPFCLLIRCFSHMFETEKL